MYKCIDNLITDAGYISHLSTNDGVTTLLLMHTSGKSFGSVYWYLDDNLTSYLKELSVKASCRKQGIGTRLQELREDISIQMGMKFSCLWVDKFSWMHEWYSRRGYSYISEKDGDYIWMRKELIK